ncbi:MAG: DUF1254 domain-containing protein [Notoacmeibacter sp.]|nr:DUF1254 domain-containing protein [Notoacmeibacter sp.]
MGRILYTLLAGLVGAGIVHISILLLVPYYSSRDAWSQVSSLSADYAFSAVAGEPARKLLADIDPLFSVAVCRFDLTKGHVHAVAKGTLPFWSVSVFNQRGENIYSFNDRNMSGTGLDVTVATPVQMVELRKELPEEFAQSIFIEADIAKGMIVLRLFRPDALTQARVNEFLASASCEAADDAQ